MTEYFDKKKFADVGQVAIYQIKSRRIIYMLNSLARGAKNQNVQLF